MITPIAYSKWIKSCDKDKSKQSIETFATMMTASNILVTDYTKKGEIVFEQIKK